MDNEQLNEIWVPGTSLVGERIEAVYHTQEVPAYQNNPLTEALPPILENEGVAQALTVAINYDEQFRNLSPQARIHSLYDITEFFAPLPNHLDLEQSISLMIRRGLAQRNPMLTAYWREVDRIESLLHKAQGFSNEQLKKLYSIPESYNVSNGIKDMIRRQRTTLLGQALLGHSGLGKSTAFELILGTYPQVIIHSNYKGKEFSFHQVVWVYLQCPHDGSLKSLCMQFFAYIDDLLGTDYMRTFANYGKKTAAQMASKISRVVAAHGIGIIVIDELQNLDAASSGGILTMMNFFMNLINIGRVPVFLVGTTEALPIVTGAFRLARRTMPIFWERMVQDEVWDYFLNSFWHYQYTQHEFPLTKELSEQLYFETQGVLDLAVKLFTFAQVRAIHNRDEIVTPETLHKVAQETFRALQPMLHDYREGKSNSDYASKYLNIDIKTFIEREMREKGPELLALLKREQEEAQKRTQEEEPNQAVSQQSAAPPNSTKKSGGKSSRKFSKREPVIMPGGLLDIFQQAEKNEQSMYEALKQAGYIESLDAFLN